MTATGIVRRIDELGRIVIPREIRNTLRIREGDPLEIFTDHDGTIILKKYSVIGSLNEIAEQFAKGVYANTGIVTLVCDRDMVVATAGMRKQEFNGKPIHSDLEEIMKKHHSVTLSEIFKGSPVGLIAGDTEPFPYSSEGIVPLYYEQECIGAIIMLCYNEGEYIKAIDIKAAETAASILIAQVNH